LEHKLLQSLNVEWQDADWGTLMDHFVQWNALL